jgi:mRNA interferase RelE/StbE
LAWAIEFDAGAVKDLRKLDRPVQERLIGFLKFRVATLDNPRDLGEPLAGARLGNYWKYRVGNWRTIFDVQEGRIVFRVLRDGNRGGVYR